MKISIGTNDLITLLVRTKCTLNEILANRLILLVISQYRYIIQEKPYEILHDEACIAGDCTPCPCCLLWGF